MSDNRVAPLAIDNLERELLYLCLSDLRDHQIAARLFISVRTVQRRLERLMHLAGAENRFALGARATQLGWIDPGQSAIAPGPSTITPGPSAVASGPSAVAQGPSAVDRPALRR